MNVSSDLRFGNIEMNACPFAILMDDVQQGDHVLSGVGDEVAVFRVPLASQFEVTRSNVVSFARGLEPSNERFNHKVEKQGGIVGPPEGSPAGSPPVRCGRVQ